MYRVLAASKSTHCMSADQPRFSFSAFRVFGIFVDERLRPSLQTKFIGRGWLGVVPPSVDGFKPYYLTSSPLPRGSPSSDETFVPPPIFFFFDDENTVISRGLELSLVYLAR